MSDMPFWKRKLYLTALFVIVCSVGYFLTNRFQVFPAIPVPETYLDHAIPYISWTVLIYISYYLLLFLPLLICKEEGLFCKMLIAYFWVVIISITIFFFFPTGYSWKPEGHNDFFTVYLYHILVSLDRDYNACPSMHVSISLIGAGTYLWYHRYTKGFLFLSWGIAVAISTLTAKRHYFLDVVAGIVVTLMVLVLVNLRKGIRHSSIAAT